MNKIFCLSFFHFLSATLQARLKERVVSFNQGSDTILGCFFFNGATESNISVQIQSNKTVNSSTLRSQSSRLYNNESLKTLENCEAVKGLIARTLQAEAQVEISELGTTTVNMS